MIPGLYSVATQWPTIERDRERQLLQTARSLERSPSRQGPARLREAPREDVVIRWAQAADVHLVRRLAALDGQQAPQSPVLLAERNGKLVAALQLSDGRAVADPFEPTSDVVGLLEMRASQLQARSNRRAPLLRRGLLRRAVPAGA